MKKTIFIFALAMIFAPQFQLMAQSKWETRTGKVTFKSKTPIEEFSSTNHQAASILKVDGDKKTLAFQVIMRSFKFEKALMEEHFNEKYVHSEKYPSAKFVGEIEKNVNFSKPGIYKGINIKGNLSLHGVTKPLTILAGIEVKENREIKGISTFAIIPEDYNITVPRLVSDKISKNIFVTVDVVYKPSK